MVNYRFIVKRFESSETDMIVAFDVTVRDSGAKKYFEALIPKNQCVGLSDNEICTIAYYKLKSVIEHDMLELVKEEAPTIIGYDYIPPDVEGYEFDI